MIKLNIDIGFKFSIKCKSSTGKIYWRMHEVVGIRYGNYEGYSQSNWKSRDDILKLKQYVQVISLPYPNSNGLPGLYDDMTNSQLSIFWEPLNELEQSIENDLKMQSQFRAYKIDENE